MPAGDYRVDLHGGSQPTATPAESLAFTVRNRPEIAIFPPPTVRVSAVGTATIEFKRMPPDNQDGVAHFAYDIRGLSQVFVMRRMEF